MAIEKVKFWGCIQAAYQEMGEVCCALIASMSNEVWCGNITSITRHDEEWGWSQLMLTKAFWF